MKNVNPNIFLYAALAFIAYKGVKSVGEFLNIVDTPAEKKEKELQEKAILTQNNKNPFSPLFYKMRPGAADLLTMAGVKLYSERINNAFGNFSDNESAVYSVFRSLKTKAQVSQIAEYFKNVWRLDLIDFLKNGRGGLHGGLNQKELAIVLKIVDGLPDYVVKK